MKNFKLPAFTIMFCFLILMVFFVIFYYVLSAISFSDFIIDGDTIKIRCYKLGNYVQNFTLRYACIDTPEKGEPFFEEAQLKNREIVNGRPLSYSVIDVDKYGRSVGFVYVYNDSVFGRLQAKLSIGGLFVNRELLMSGLGVYYRVTPICDSMPTLLYAQKYAFDNRLGLWRLYNKYKDKQFIKGSYAFHLANCQKIRSRRKKIITLQEAIYQGISPCRKCKPLLTLYLNDKKR